MPDAVAVVAETSARWPPSIGTSESPSGGSDQREGSPPSRRSTSSLPSTRPTACSVASTSRDAPTEEATPIRSVSRSTSGRASRHTGAIASDARPIASAKSSSQRAGLASTPAHVRGTSPPNSAAAWPSRSSGLVDAIASTSSAGDVAPARGSGVRQSGSSTCSRPKTGSSAR